MKTAQQTWGMTMNIEIRKIVVMLTDATDKVFIYTDIPCPFVPAAIPSQPPLTMGFDATYDKGIEYVKTNFGIEPEVINVRR